MKKLGMTLGVMMTLLFSAVFAQSGQLEKGSVELKLCNNQSNIHMQAGVQTGFCIMANNMSASTGLLKVAFADGEVMSGKTMCKTTTSGYFSQFTTLSGLATANDIVLPPNTGIVQRASLNIPAGFIGTLHGCVQVVSQTGSGKVASGTNKMYPIDVVVSGAYVNRVGLIDVKRFSGANRQFDTTTPVLSATTPILLMQTGSENVLVLGLENTGFIDEDYVVSGVIYNEYFGYRLYEKSFVIGSGVLKGQDTVVLQQILEDLPFYKGAFSIVVDTAHTPSGLSGLVAEGKAMTDRYELSFTVYPNIYLAIGIVGALLLAAAIIVTVVVIKKKPEQTPATPVVDLPKPTV